MTAELFRQGWNPNIVGEVDGQLVHNLSSLKVDGRKITTEGVLSPGFGTKKNIPFIIAQSDEEIEKMLSDREFNGIQYNSNDLSWFYIKGRMNKEGLSGFAYSPLWNLKYPATYYSKYNRNSGLFEGRYYLHPNREPGASLEIGSIFLRRKEGAISEN